MLNTLFFLTWGIYSLVRVMPLSADMGITPLIVPSLKFGNVAALLLASIGISKKRNFFFYFAIALLCVNIMGVALLGNNRLVDIAAVLLDLVLLALLPMLPPWDTEPPILKYH